MKKKSLESLIYKIHTNLNNNATYLEFKIKKNNEIYNNLIKNSKTSGFLIAIISLVIFVLASAKMSQDINKLQKVNDEILFMNQTLNNAEMVAGFGSWKLNLVSNTFILSDNFVKLLGVNPKGFVPSLDVLLDIIHPEDREEARKSHINSLNTKEPTTIFYRNLLKDGTVKHMMSVGKFMCNIKGEEIKIGVSQDITELIKKTKEVEENNAKLIAINSELESFNNIVSHDLQEPLRKIQMFISRIENKEFLETASETTIGYFDKIKFSAKRMQNLMADLVSYTKTLKGDRIFESVNLNEIFNEIKEELSYTIEEKKAKIDIDKFPEIIGIKFQFQQLFINLISNALKYVKSDVNPVISVKLENFSQDIINNKIILSDEFYKISITDNGIGFEQQHSDKIFMLFKRLPTNEAYKGTGLGLAICRKIIENHNGYITAQGIENNGSVFTVYLLKQRNGS